MLIFPDKFVWFLCPLCVYILYNKRAAGYLLASLAKNLHLSHELASIS